jgi:phage terminase small subunit
VPRKSSAAVAFSATTSARLQPPSDLAEPEKTLFVDLVLACRADHFQPSDTPLLAAYCRAVVLEQTASGELAASGFITAEGKASPWLAVLQQATRAMTTLSRMLRLNPAGRQSTPSSESEQVSYYDRMALEGRRDDGTDGRN